MVIKIPTATVPSSCSCAARILRKKAISAGTKKRRFAGKLRKLRWVIYQRIKFKKKRLKRLFEYFKKQVDLFLTQFSSNLKPFEVVIWKQKVTTNWNDVSKYLCDQKKATATAVDMPVKTKPDVDGSSKLDSILGMLSTILHLVRVTQDKNATPEQESLSSNVKVLESHEPSVESIKVETMKATAEVKNEPSFKLTKAKRKAIAENVKLWLESCYEPEAQLLLGSFPRFEEWWYEEVK